MIVRHMKTQTKIVRVKSMAKSQRTGLWSTNHSNRDMIRNEKNRRKKENRNYDARNQKKRGREMQKNTEQKKTEKKWLGLGEECDS